MSDIRIKKQTRKERRWGKYAGVILVSSISGYLTRDEEMNGVLKVRDESA